MRSGRDRRSLGDAVTITIGLALLSWVFLVLPSATDPSFNWQQRIVSAAYPVGDLLILVSLGRLLVPGGWRGAALWLLTVGSLAGIASDVGYDLVQNSPPADGSQWLSLGWLLCYAACGAAALHPSMTELTRPTGQASEDLTAR